MHDPGIKKRGLKGKHSVNISNLPEASRNRLMLQAGFQEFARRVPVPAGGLLLWSSHTTHQGWQGGPRLAQTVCWEPVERRGPLARERKLRMAAMGLPSSHWPSGGVLHGMARSFKGYTSSESVRSHVRSVVLTPEADQDELVQMLAGYDWNRALPAEALAVLESAVSEEFKHCL
eukprot:TRINITY_DN29451_c0_g1_i2.p3 TRINITY_DN29451_c0_g1~~TRINITY_DN29451_c0_g1_i2.p3  ORF type:complete len:175 (+),score=32.65 TRINITY_DN29451_c0_g1_i2:585-1109(+)